MTRIGVSGHRHFNDLASVTATTMTVLDRLLERAPTATIISSLAEGADRLVAELVLGHLDATLEVILPMPTDDYLDDFASQNSTQQFHALLRRATSVVVVEQLPGDSRPARYERAGRALVDSCDILVALWDGYPSRGQGSTADVIRYAMDNDVLVEVILVERDAL